MGLAPILRPWHLLVIALAGWINREQHRVIEYLITENQVLRIGVIHFAVGMPF